MFWKIFTANDGGPQQIIDGQKFVPLAVALWPAHCQILVRMNTVNPSNIESIKTRTSC